MRIVSVRMRLLGDDGRSVEMTEWAPWPERAGLWEAEEHIDHDGECYRYVGCEDDVYLYRQVRRCERRAAHGCRSGAARAAG